MRNTKSASPPKKTQINLPHPTGFPWCWTLYQKDCYAKYKR